MIADQPPGRRPKGLLMLRTRAMPQDANPNGGVVRPHRILQCESRGDETREDLPIHRPLNGRNRRPHRGRVGFICCRTS